MYSIVVRIEIWLDYNRTNNVQNEKKIVASLDESSCIIVRCDHHGNNHHVMDLKSIGDATAYPSRFVVDSTRAKHSLFDSNSSSNRRSRWQASLSAEVLCLSSGTSLCWSL
mmetsp:Transcript_10191/g.11643  ORF Transcript_10191/g.11643 Transcript_10191/m.11643 type:complete len:111 (-) Transcript_10191:122-454(-)